MATTARTAKTALHNCECANWEFDLDVDREDDYSTGCTAQTHRIFAQGHDAKLVGFMVRAEMAGHEISKRDGGMLVTFGGAVDAAASISPALATKVEAQMAAALGRLNKKAAKAPRVTAVRAEAEVKPEATLVPAKIKVGRWTYDAMINSENGDATYARKLGGQQTISRVDYKIA